MVEYSYFPGCNLKTDARGFEKSAIAVSKKLESELVEIPNWNCCGTVHTMTTDNLMKRIAPVRVLARSRQHVEESSRNYPGRHGKRNCKQVRERWINENVVSKENRKKNKRSLDRHRKKGRS